MLLQCQSRNTLQSTAQTKFQNFKRLASIWITGDMHTTPNAATEAMLTSFTSYHQKGSKVGSITIIKNVTYRPLTDTANIKCNFKRNIQTIIPSRGDWKYSGTPFEKKFHNIIHILTLYTIGLKMNIAVFSD